jgi:hypothetical protein
MTALSDLIPDPSTRGLWECRPASISLGAGIGAPFSSGFSSGFKTSLFPSPFGAVSCLLIAGDTAYGLFAAGTANQDYPFAFNLKTHAFISISNVTPGSGGNLPTRQLSSGDWTPPTMDIIGSTVLVTHPGFAGTSNFLGWFDITDPVHPAWNAGNFHDQVTPPVTNQFLFSAATGVPVAVKAFNGRAYWAYNPPAGPSATVFTDVLAPLLVSNVGAVQVITYDDNVAITALGALPLSNQLGGIIQSLIVFKGVANMYQITGDISLGPGPPLGTLTKNALNVATGTFAPNSLASTPKGLAFCAPDGVRVIDFNANVSDPLGNDGMGKTVPFLFAVAPSRIAAAANGTVYRVSVQDGSAPQSPMVEYWLDFSRGGIWSGPHSFPARLIKPYRATFITAPYAAPAALFQSDYVQTLASTFIENGVPMTFSWLTCMLPDTDQMSENAMIETTIYLGQAPGASYNVHALNESGSALGMVVVGGIAGATIWGEFKWGAASWGGQPSSLFPQRIAWAKPVVFRRLAMNVMGPASQQFRIGTMHMKYEQLGYLQQPLGSAA